jgi:hypothetical protein
MVMETGQLQQYLTFQCRTRCTVRTCYSSNAAGFGKPYGHINFTRAINETNPSWAVVEI